MKSCKTEHGTEVFIIDDNEHFTLEESYKMSDVIQVHAETNFAFVKIPSSLKVISGGLRIYDSFILTRSSSVQFIATDRNALELYACIGQPYFNQFEIIPPKGKWSKKTLDLFKSFFHGEQDNATD